MVRPGQSRVPKAPPGAPVGGIAGPPFKLVFLCVFVLTIGCFGFVAYLALFGDNPLPEAQMRAFDLFSNVGLAGSGALIGLLGGKTLP